MFVARVLVGNAVSLDSDNTLRRPPMIPNTDPSIPYDSVKGRTKGSDVYMVYSNKKAYP